MARCRQGCWVAINSDHVDVIKRDGWNHHVAYRDGEPVADVFIKGCEIHFESRVEKKAMTRKNTLEFLKKVYDQFGYVMTSVPLDVTDHKLRKILGFQYMNSDNLFSYWVLTELPFQKVQR